METNAEASSSRVSAAEEAGPTLPHLATPDSFPFPYPQPYSIQLDLMKTVFAALEDRKIAIVSPVAATRLTEGRVTYRNGQESHAAHCYALMAERTRQAARRRRGSRPARALHGRRPGR